MFFRAMIFGGPRPQEALDRPISNYDVIGIPTGAWSSHFCAFLSNLVPSCVVSFLCPCVMWGQIVVRAQIPLLISVKNGFPCLQRVTGFGFFVDVFFWSAAVSAALIIVVVMVSLPEKLIYLLAIVVFVLLGCLVFAIGHTRTAFREKYLLPGLFPPGCHFWDMLFDLVLSVTCLPCALSQMARHVFQYDHMDSKLGLFLQDPATLPPLRSRDIETGDSNSPVFDRPERADNAGLTWTHNGRHPHARDNSGAAHRQEEIQQRQHQQMRDENAAYGQNQNATVPVAAVVRVQPATRAGSSGTVYNADGSKA